jgi:hypothetical protein
MKIGTLVLSKAGWTSHHISTGEGLQPISFDIGSTPRSYTLGTLGMPGYNKTIFIRLFYSKLITELDYEKKCYCLHWIENVRAKERRNCFGLGSCWSRR